MILSVYWRYNKDSGEGVPLWGLLANKKDGVTMSVKYKIDVLAALKDSGYTTYKLRRDKLLGESVIQQLRKGALVSWPNMGRLCHLLNCQPGDILEYEEDPAESVTDKEQPICD